jgi:hypothetical protein
MRKKLDNRIPTLITNNVKKNHRSFIVLVGDKGRDQVDSSNSQAFGKSDKFLDRKPTFLAFSSSCVCTPVRAMVLQKGSGIYQASSSLQCGTMLDATLSFLELYLLFYIAI